MGVLRARTVIVAPGAFSRKLNVPGEDTFRGKGVSFCSTCDAPFYKDKVVAVIGGGDSAVQEGLFTARFAARVFLIHRRDTLRATRIIQEKALANPIVEIRLNTVVEGILGDQRVRALALRNMRTGEKSELSVDGVFIYVGMQPNTNFLVGKVSLDPDGYVITNERMQTNLPGVFAAGDVRRPPLRQVVTAMSDGAIDATYADWYLSGAE